MSSLCLFTYSGVQHILCCVFLRLVYTMLPVSLECPFLITPSVFSTIYLYLELEYLPYSAICLDSLSSNILHILSPENIMSLQNDNFKDII